MDNNLYQGIILEHQLLRPKKVNNHTTHDVIQ